MKTQAFSFLVLSAIAATPAAAQQFNGATVSAAFQSVDDEVFGEYDVTSFAAGAEFGITPDFAIGANIETISADDYLIDDIFVGTVHGIYNLGSGTSLGLFYSYDTIEDLETNIVGIEAAFTAPNSEFSGYLGAVDSDLYGGDVLRMLGLALEFGIGSGFSLGIDYESYRVEDAGIVESTGELEDGSFTDTALFARYGFADGASVYAKVGTERLYGSDRDDDVTLVGVNASEYITIGAEFDLGAGTTFGSRSILNFGG